MLTCNCITQEQIIEIHNSFYPKNLIVKNAKEIKNLRKELDGINYISLNYMLKENTFKKI